MKNFTLLSFAFILFSSCGTIDSGATMEDLIKTTIEYDLSNHNVPLTINLPDGVSIKKGLLNTSQGGVNLVNLDIEKGKFDMSVFFLRCGSNWLQIVN